VLKKPGASPLLFGKFLNEHDGVSFARRHCGQPARYDESVLSVEMDEELAKAYENSKRTYGSAIRSHRATKA